MYRCDDCKTRFYEPKMQKYLLTKDPYDIYDEPCPACPVCGSEDYRKVEELEQEQLA